MKKFVFVLMPFNEEFDDVYHLGIKAACNSDKVYCERVDEQIYEGNMLDRIYNQIQHADYIIADMSTKNPNVFYEVGYAHALQKKVILITQEESDIPFDLKHYYHIIYSKKHLKNLNEQIRNRIEWYLANPNNDTVLQPQLEVYINGYLIKEKQDNYFTINIIKYHQTYKGSIHVLFSNPTSKIYSFSETELHMIFSSNTPLKFLHKANFLPDGKLILSDFAYKHILPHSYGSSNIEIEFEDEMFFSYGYCGEIYICLPHTQFHYPFNFDIELYDEDV